MVVRLYGEFDCEHSTGRVSRGFASVFTDAIQYNVSGWGNDLDDTESLVPGATAKVGVFTANLAFLHTLNRANHEKTWVMVAPNSDTLGPQLTRSLAARNCGLLAPSNWAMRILRKHFPEKEILCVPHGVSEVFRPQARREPDGEFRVLHISSSEQERKGTTELLEGWALVAHENWRLFVSVPSAVKAIFAYKVHELGLSKTVFLTDRLNFSVEAMAGLYNSMDLVAQPSRGEGFGLVPLEARCCGTPVLMTDCTGHSQHAFGPGITLVPSRNLAPIDDFPGALAPEGLSRDVAESLAHAYKHREVLVQELVRGGHDLRANFSWSNQLKEFRNVS